MTNYKLKAKIIEKYGLQGDFAQILGINESIISRVIRGRKCLSETEHVHAVRRSGSASD